AEALRLTTMRAGAAAKAGTPGPEGSVLKPRFAEINKAIYELCLDLLGPAGLVDFDYTMKRSEIIGLEGAPGTARKMFLRSPAKPHRGGHAGDHAQHPRRAGARPPGRAPHRQGPPLGGRPSVVGTGRHLSCTTPSSCVRWRRSATGWRRGAGRAWPGPATWALAARSRRWACPGCGAGAVPVPPPAPSGARSARPGPMPVTTTWWSTPPRGSRARSRTGP